MKEYFGVLQKVELFRGIAEADLESMLRCLGAEARQARRDEVLLLAGDRPEQIGVLLAGQLHIVREDYEGNRSLIAAVTPGEIFAEALCCAGVRESPVTVVADTDSTVLLLRFSRIPGRCPELCSFHAVLIENMLGLMANKNLQLQSRMEMVGLKSVRAKVMRFLESAMTARGEEFAIAFNRGELADFLCVERSALSHELARMKRDGLIEYKKNRFILK